MQSFKEFLYWEKTTKDTLDLKKIYIDLAGSIPAGMLLSQIIYWHLPSEETKKSKMKVKKGGHLWLAKLRSDWFREIRITERQYDKAIQELEELGIVIVENHMFDGKKTPFIRIEEELFLQAMNLLMDAMQKAYDGIDEDNKKEQEKAFDDYIEETKRIRDGLKSMKIRFYEKCKTGLTQSVKPESHKVSNPNHTKSKIGLTQSVKPITKNTTETTSEITAESTLFNKNLPAAKEIWNSSTEYLKDLLSVVSFNTWIKPIIPLDINDEVITFGVEIEYNKKIIEARYIDMIKNAVKYATGKEYEVIIKSIE